MSIKAVLFDLDGTLLPMDNDTFVKDYLGRLCRTLAPRGYVPQEVVNALWTAVAAMVKNNGQKNNEAVFWDVFSQLLGERVRDEIARLDEFYATDFQQAKASCGFTPRAAEVIERLHNAGVRCVLATNPIFPAIATESRTRWAGLQPSDFEWITTYENSCFCKPNPAYYRDILDRLQLRAEECVMVGNDVAEDMIAETLGMRVFLLTDCLLNKAGTDIAALPQGDFDALNEFLSTLGIA